ncbi:glycosyltransferase [Kibdelosporangium aridum]|uniref:Glycosyltransferase GtfC n=2 Tax=Pseudonocardiaceae TaxID=2070 RepID=GTFC_AMYOR|nr:glycosyltransferase [Kibdelosporangium aridum]P96560.1 RecName: Full=Glycosyltransferase GtfC [Amycolatopsis orientalis]AAB49294.1 glycosyltransferase GtfC [Amycolatopsis orientalis]RSM88007.1 glycosyltransferase [Kibdelosporangium aridum]CAA11776.1 PCZA361.21 [Amycolatopsis orientalis]
MRVLLSTAGSRGDVEPLVALAVRLQGLGVEARMCASPASAERLAEVGVPHVPVGLQLEGMLLQEGMPPPSPEEERRLAAKAIDMQFDEVPAAAEGCAAVVAAGELAAAAAVRSVAEMLGIPYFYAAYSPNYLPSPHHAPPEDERTTPGVTDNKVLWDERGQRFAKRYGDTLNSRRASVGLPPVEDVFGYGYSERPWLATDPILAPLPPDFDAVQTGTWILPDERPLSAELEAFLAAGSPPVYLGFGSASGPGIDDAARVAIEAIRAHGRRIVLLSGWADLVRPDDGADCFSVDEVNLQVLFSRAAAAIHHGSAGTEHLATLAGIPQIVIPRHTDQPYYAERVADLGIGVALEGPVPTFDAMSAAVATALAPETRARATAVAGTIRTDGAAVAARLLLDAVSREKSAVLA